MTVASTSDTHEPDRERSAYHEAAHAVAAIALGFGVRAVSLRPGERFRAAVYLAPSRRRSRWAREDQIVVTLAGDLHYLAGGPPLTGYVPASCAEAEARAAVVELARVPRHTRATILAAEADPEGVSDADSAWGRGSLLNGHPEDPLLIASHLHYLTARAGAIIRRHPRQVHALAQRAYRDTVVPGDEAARIVTWWLCPCHDDWGAGQRGRAPAL